MSIKFVAFGLTGVLINLPGADNPWDFIRKTYNIPNYWAQYLAGKISRETAKKEEYRSWKEINVNISKLTTLFRNEPTLVSGVGTVVKHLKDNKIISAIVSNSPSFVVTEIANKLGIKYTAYNRVVFTREGYAYDTVPTHPSKDHRVDKLAAIREFSYREDIKLSETAFITSNPEDIPTFRFVGLSIAFNTTNVDLKKAAHISVNSNSLADVLDYIK